RRTGILGWQTESSGGENGGLTGDAAAARRPAVRPTAFRPPLYPLLLAAIGWGDRVPAVAVGILHLLLGVATVGLVEALSRRWDLASHGAVAEVEYAEGYPATINTKLETRNCAEVAAEIVGRENLVEGVEPRMGSEDFAFMLERKPGCYILIGNGELNGESGCYLHNPNYDFNDEVSVIGASYWARLAETLLKRG
ncbi:MAG: M20/M25/M40 family metallo-hydrolase, partial [Kiloniellales bacterium]|nr:M20/M25/M40 family metallo-hydrolase [Kiloniellales bacterium]